MQYLLSIARFIKCKYFPSDLKSTTLCACSDCKFHDSVLPFGYCSEIEQHASPCNMF